MPQQVPERLGVDLAGKAERLGAGAEPGAGRFLRAGVVLLGAAGDRVDVVRVLARRQLPEAQHDIPFRIPRSRARRHRTTRASASESLEQSVGESSVGMRVRPRTGRSDRYGSRGDALVA